MTNFIGTTDNQPLKFKTNNFPSGIIDPVSQTVGLGAGALFANTGIKNTALGFNALNLNTTATNNTGIGWIALSSNSTGNSNTAVGSSTLFFNTAGSNNTAVGMNALYNNTASNNTAFGAYALAQNTSGTSNTSVGYQSLFNNVASQNTGIGHNALLSNTTGTSNTALGYGSNSLNTTGSNNTAIGWLSLNSSLSANNNTAVGSGALNNNTTGDINTAVGYNALISNLTGSNNTAVGNSAGSGTAGISFSSCTFLGGNSNLTVARSNVTMLGSGITNAECTGSSQVLLGNVGITQIRANVTGITSYSDARFKTNMNSNVVGLDFILKLKPVTYNERPSELHRIWGTPDSLIRKTDFSDNEKTRFIGFLAQDVEKAAKESGFSFPGLEVPKNEKEVYSLRYVDFIMPLVKAVQEQQKQIDDLKTELNQLKKQMVKK